MTNEAGGDAPERDPDLAVVVLSYGPRPTLVGAVRSLLTQDDRTEIVVVHSGGGELPDALVSQPRVQVVVSPDRLLPGAARNLGIASTRAAFVAFLADDCLASPGWVRHRVSLHRAGVSAVASALTCHRPRSPIALAAHLSLYFRRMPGADPALALRYGVSYTRALFERYGVFRDDLESGEDTEFNQRLAAHDAPAWAPEVVTVHIGPETLPAFFQAQWRRGQRMAIAWRALGAYSPTKVAGNALSRTATILNEMWRVVESRAFGVAILSVPLIVCGNIMYACGALAARTRS
ncbi:MAG: glycosyltransferase family 2 protein [Hyphomonadaceae bacterium]|nr:glycosyltransferase family 2 protein [Hyphomonadaceae bacterium]